MSRIDDLIAKYCPNGVEMDTIGNLCKINRGRVMSKDYLAANQGDYPVYSSQTANEGMLGKIKTYDYDGEYLTWTTDGAYAGSVFYRKGKFSITNICGLLDLQSDKLLIKFLYYYLGNVTKNYVNAGMGNPKLMSNVMERIKVAVPPLAVQEEIVNILDSFTLLEAELEAELVVRKKQYEHYRDKLLNFADISQRGGVRIMALGEICDIQNGFAFKSTLFKQSGSPILRISNIQQSGVVLDNLAYFDKDDYKVNLEQFKVYPQDIVIALSGATTGKSGKNNTNMIFYLNQRVAKFVPHKDILSNNYLYHVIQDRTDDFLQMAGGGAQPNLSTEQMKKMMIPIPPLAEQERIVSMLDKFDALVNDISDGLPAEINARRQQYEYYRDKLLNFEPIAV